MDSKLKIFKSSAGSGKTYALVKEYLLIAFQNPNNFKGILAITFTNKAANEMKTRIINQLIFISEGKIDSMSEDISTSLNISPKDLQIKSQNLLSLILHNYTKFSVGTIDSFAQNIISSFSRELGYKTGFDIEMDQEYVLEEIVNDLIQKSNNKIEESDKTSSLDLLKVLLEFSEKKLEEGRSWNIKEDLISFGREIFKEEFFILEDKILDFFNTVDQKKYISKIVNEVKDFEKTLNEFGENACFEIINSGISIDNFAYGQKGVAGFFNNIRTGSRYELSKRAIQASQDIEKWSSKNSPYKDVITYLVNNKLKKILDDIIQYYRDNEKKYKSNKAILPLYYVSSLTNYFLNSINKFRKENGVMLISDTNIFIKNLINENDSPYIYEKTGSRYNHFLIDEFQDVSDLQWQNLSLLIKNALSEGGSTILVGDTKQSIYRWRGGNPSILNEQINHEFKNYQIENNYLNTNWRSNDEIISFNNSFFKKSSELIFKLLDNSINDLSDDIQENAHEFLNSIASSYNKLEQKTGLKNIASSKESVKLIPIEGEHIYHNFLENELIKQIEKLQQSGIQPGDIGILVRNNKEATLVAEFLNEYSTNTKCNPKVIYDYCISSALFLKDNISIRLTISFFRWIINREDRISFIEIIHYYRQMNNRGDISLIDYFDNKITNKQLLDFLPSNFKSLVKKSFSLEIPYLLKELQQTFQFNDNPYFDKFIETINQINNLETKTIKELLSWWDKKGQRLSIEISNQKDKINILTIHQSKGLQFHSVIIPFANWELDHNPQIKEILWCRNFNKKEYPPVFPVYYSKKLLETDFQQDYFKERVNTFYDNLNLLYVAFTRAKENLIVYYSEKEQKSSSIDSVSDLISGFR